MQNPKLRSALFHFSFHIFNSATALSLLGVTNALSPSAPATVRIVGCDQPVKSAKRGLCLNQMSREDFMALSPSVSWWYNWHFTDTQNPPAEARMEFLPMAWGHANDVEGLRTYLRSHKPSRVLAVNEPNLKGQAFMTPQETATLYQRIKTVADSFRVPVIGPHMALGSATDSSIKAMDPLEKKMMTYTFMTPFLKAFFYYVGQTDIPAAAAHTY